MLFCKLLSFLVIHCGIDCQFTHRAVERESGTRGRDMMRAFSVPKFDSVKKKKS